MHMHEKQEVNTHARMHAHTHTHVHACSCSKLTVLTGAVAVRMSYLHCPSTLIHHSSDPQEEEEAHN